MRITLTKSHRGRGGVLQLENKIVTRGKGHSAVAAAAYNAAEKLYDERTGTTYDFTRKQDVYHSEILAPANAPAWVFDRKQLWNQAESHEKRVDSQVARQLILSLPNCLSHDEKLHVTRRFLQRECVAMGMAADVAFHDFEGDKSHNPHAHVLLTMREVGSDGFAAKKNRNWNKVAQHQLWRERWADHLNQHFEQKGYDARVDHRSYAAQGIDRMPQIHEGRAVRVIRDQIANGQRTQTTSAIDFNSKVMEFNQLQREIATLQREIAEEEKRQLQAVQQNVQEQDHTAASRSKTPSSAAEEITSNAMQAVLLDKKLATQDASIKKENVQSPAKSTENAPSHARPNAPPREPRDRTYLAVKNQLTAMGGNGWFEIGIRHDAEDAAKSYFHEKTWHKDHLLKVDPETGKTPVLNYLKAENACGSDIYVRPARLPNGDTQGLILLDDLDPVMVEDLHDQGLQPCVVVETSFKNCQVWIKICDRLKRDESSHLAKILAKETGGDPGSAGYQHYGRLARFTNRKEKHLDVYSGKYPWVMLREAQMRQASQASHFQELARRASSRRESPAARSDGEAHCSSDVADGSGFNNQCRMLIDDTQPGSPKFVVIFLSWQTNTTL
ncbi:MAG: MobQ family relaxase [Nostoc sp.]|uniref:MobQ family relaxase n=1 Tax=Nostoc sp. TaxID=1180 RepID=UPI002FFC4B9E